MYLFFTTLQGVLPILINKITFTYKLERIIRIMVINVIIMMV